MKTHHENKTHIDLFSGIGGFAYAADRVWPGIRHTFEHPQTDVTAYGGVE